MFPYVDGGGGGLFFFLEKLTKVQGEGKEIAIARSGRIKTSSGIRVNHGSSGKATGGRSGALGTMGKQAASVWAGLGD